MKPAPHALTNDSTITITTPFSTLVLLPFNFTMFHLPFFKISTNITFTNLPMMPLTWWRLYLSTGKNQNTARSRYFFCYFFPDYS
jgi:hypothetical protein